MRSLDNSRSCAVIAQQAITLVVLVVSPSRADDVDNDINASVIIQLYGDIHEAMHAYGVTADVNALHAVPGPEEWKYRSQSASIQMWLDSSGRVRTESMSQSETSSADAKKRKWLAVFDGEVVKSMDGSPRGFNSAEVDSSRGMAFFQGIDPLNYVTQVRGRLFSDYIRKLDPRVVDADSATSEDDIAVETRVRLHAASGREFMTRFILSPQHGFAIHEATENLRFPPEEKWKTYYRVTTSGHEQCSSGIWLPRQAVHEEYGMPTSADVEPKLLVRYDITFRQWDLHPAVDDSLFTLEFPSSIVVEDNVSGRTFKATDITDQTIADQVAFASSLAGGEPVRQHLLGRRSLYLTIGVCTVVASVLVCLFTLRRRRRHSDAVTGAS